MLHGDDSRIASASSEEELLSLGILGILEGKTFKGEGYACIFRPRSLHPLDGQAVKGDPDAETDLQLSLTKETTTFSQLIGRIPNRGLIDQPDILLAGLTYTTSVEDVTNEATGRGDLEPGAMIHIETGTWIAIPRTPGSKMFPKHMVCRMASIPHGTTMSAQGLQPDLTPVLGKPTFDRVHITPFLLESGVKKRVHRFDSQILETRANRIPLDLMAFDANGTVTQSILDNPNQILTNAICDQVIVDFIKFTLTTDSTDDFGGGGVTNIAFLSGLGTKAERDSHRGRGPNAQVTSVQATYWIETVEYRFSVPGGNPEETCRSPPGGCGGPLYRVPPTIGREGEVEFATRYRQVQYSQTVLLDFFGLMWPHVSVGTLREQDIFELELPS